MLVALQVPRKERLPYGLATSGGAKTLLTTPRRCIDRWPTAVATSQAPACCSSSCAWRCCASWPHRAGAPLAPATTSAARVASSHRRPRIMMRASINGATAQLLPLAQSWTFGLRFLTCTASIALITSLGISTSQALQSSSSWCAVATERGHFISNGQVQHTWCWARACSSVDERHHVATGMGCSPVRASLRR